MPKAARRTKKVALEPYRKKPVKTDDCVLVTMEDDIILSKAYKIIEDFKRKEAEEAKASKKKNYDVLSEYLPHFNESESKTIVQAYELINFKYIFPVQPSKWSTKGKRKRQREDDDAGPSKRNSLSQNDAFEIIEADMQVDKEPTSNPRSKKGKWQVPNSCKQVSKGVSQKNCPRELEKLTSSSFLGVGMDPERLKNILSTTRSGRKFKAIEKWGNF